MASERIATCHRRSCESGIRSRARSGYIRDLRDSFQSFCAGYIRSCGGTLAHLHTPGPKLTEEASHGAEERPHSSSSTRGPRILWAKDEFLLRHARICDAPDPALGHGTGSRRISMLTSARVA